MCNASLHAAVTKEIPKLGSIKVHLILSLSVYMLAKKKEMTSRNAAINTDLNYLLLQLYLIIYK